jgi:hypothetical protein
MRTTSKTVLLCSVSALAIVAVLPVIAQAADIPTKAAYKAAPLPAVSPWTFWIEGGAQAVSGADSAIAGLTPAFTPAKKTWGWDGAAAIDYRIDAMWHVGVDFRYGANKNRTTDSRQSTASTFTAGTIANSATRKESNWVADFMVGRDLGLGAGTSQLKFGLRVAQIKGTTDGVGVASGTQAFAYSQTNKWTGYGPRVALEGNAPISGPWSLDYMGGVAALFGSQSVSQTGTCISGGAAGCPVNATSSSNNAVFNADAMLGLAYAVTPHSKLALNYRVDYYANAMREFSSVGAASNASRTYHGPNLRWTVNF